MYIKVLDNIVKLATYKIITIIDINNTELRRQLNRHQNESFGLIAYSESEKDTIISILSSFQIAYTIEALTYENETLEKAKNNKYSSRSEALADLDVQPLTLDEYKQKKNDEFSSICNAEILATFKSSAMGVEHIYSFSYDAQINFQATKSLFRDGMITEMEWSTWDAGNIVHNEQQFNKLYLDGVNHKLSKINKYRVLKDQVNACVDKDEVDAIVWE